jgi:hypothetical protein
MRAAELQAVEAAHLDILRGASTKARVRIWTLADFLDAPGEALKIVRDVIAGPVGHALVSPPQMVDLSGLREALQALRDEGMLPHVVGDISRLPAARPAPSRPRAMN